MKGDGGRPRAEYAATPVAAPQDRSDDAVEGQAAPVDPFRAWRLGVVYAPVARAVEAILASSDIPVPRVLEIGGERGVLAAMLAARASGAVDVASFDTFEAAEASSSWGAFDCAVAVDALHLVSPSGRDARMRALARSARGVVVAGPFASDHAEEAVRRLNVVHRAATGEDAASLGRAIELGLPDLEVTRGSLAAELEFVHAMPLESVSAWQLAEGIGALDALRDRTAAVAPAAAALFADLGPSADDQHTYRWLLAAAARPFAPPAAAGQARASGAAAFAAFLALELASQRRAFERLSALVSSAREREREEFKGAVEALSLDLREREAAAEALTLQIRRRDHAISDLKAAIADWEARAEDLEEVQEMTQVHVRNLEAIIAREAERADAEAARADAERARADAEARRADHERGRAELAERVHADFLDGRLGRAATAYLNLKRRLLGRRD